MRKLVPVLRAVWPSVSTTPSTPRSMSCTRRISNVSTPITTRTTTRPRPTDIHHQVTSSGAYPETDEAAGRCERAASSYIFHPSPPERLSNGEQVIDDG